MIFFIAPGEGDFNLLLDTLFTQSVSDTLCFWLSDFVCLYNYYYLLGKKWNRISDIQKKIHWKFDKFFSNFCPYLLYLWVKPELRWGKPSKMYYQLVYITVKAWGWIRS